MNVSYVMPKFLFSLTVLALFTSCAVQPVDRTPDFLYPGKPARKHVRAMSPKLKERSVEKNKSMLKAAPSFVVQPPVDVSTNLLLFTWQHPSDYVPGSTVSSYNLYFGVTPGVYDAAINFPNSNDLTNYTLQIVDQTMSTNPPIDLMIFPNGATYTNTFRFYFALSAVGLQEGALSKEITWPDLPWNTLFLSWDSGRDATIQQTPSLRNPVWTTVTNVIGTNMISLPITGTNLFYRAVTTNPPPVQLHINGAYIAP